MMNGEDSAHALQLETFSGPLPFLLHLVQKKEICLSEVTLKSIADQIGKWIEKEKTLDVNGGVEFLSIAASLLWMKSRWLLPNQPLEDEEEECDPFLTLIPDLIEYCQFKQIAKNLEKQEGCREDRYPRAFQLEFPFSGTASMGTATSSLELLTEAFRAAYQRSEGRMGEIHEEEWLVSDLIQWLKKELKAHRILYIDDLFHPSKLQGELIVTFLAILELMKIGFLTLDVHADSQKLGLQITYP